MGPKFTSNLFHDFLELIMRGTKIKIKTKLKDSVGFEPLDKVGPVKLIQ